MLCAVGARAETVGMPAAVAPVPRAQRLVEETLTLHPELMHLVMHVTPPGNSDAENRIVASNIGRIGKLADEDDLRIMRSGVPESVLAKSGDRFSVSLPLLDRTGRTIGVLAVAFRYRVGDDTTHMPLAAGRIRDELRQRIASVDSLFDHRSWP